ncbi:MAG: metal-sensitive transcriptional regulator [Spirochaetia bacterium]|nr:metal-sensitive transcriptional regulator [Spirochaetia bacterium]
MHHCSVKKAHHSDKTKKALADRLNRIEGQIRGISRMVEEDIYCDDILHQIFSVESALAGVKKSLLESHLKSCVLDQIKNGDEEVIDEFMNTIRKMLK